MDLSWAIALLGFAVAASVTPGPNNVMVAASAARHGIAATLPHMIGITVGFAAMIFLVGLAMESVVAQMATIAAVVRWIGLAWLLLLAWRIASAPPPGEGDARPPLGFIGGAMFQWVNPKAWLLALGVNAIFVQPAQGPMLPQLVGATAIFFLVTLPSIMVWAVLGSNAARLLTSPTRLRVFNIAMAVLLVISMVPVVFE